MKPRALVAAAFVLGVGTAHAEVRAKLFPLSSSGMPKSMKGASGELTDVLSRSLGVETTTVTIDDAAQMLECSLVDTSCLEDIAKKVGVKRILFGKVEGRDGGATVKVTTFEVGKGETLRSISIKGGSVDALGESLRDALEEKDEPDPPPRSILETPPPKAETTSTGGVTSGTYAMVIGGGVTTAAGGVLLLSTLSLRAELKRAPNRTAEDIQFIQGLVKAGQQRMIIGGVLTGVGAVFTTVGVVRMFKQKGSARPEEPRLDIVPESGGASVRFSMGWK